VLFSAFLIFKMDAFRASLSAWIVEFVLVLVFYRMPLLKSLEASVWGNLSMWTGFLVLYTGQIFGQAYRSTGLLEILLESIRSMLPNRDLEGRSVALVTLVAGFIGAFNGFATYPVTIPGLVDIGFDGVQATTSYLVYFSWTIPFNSLFIAPNISNAASHVPVVDIVRCWGTAYDSPCVSVFARLFENFRLPILCMENSSPILDHRPCQHHCHRSLYASLALLLYSDDDWGSCDFACGPLRVRATRERASCREIAGHCASTAFVLRGEFVQGLCAVASGSCHRPIDQIP
jgi:hypothetical protein